MPQLQNVITEAFFLPNKKPSSSSSTPKHSPILVKLATSQIKIAILKSISATPDPTEVEKNSGTRRLHIAEDLTPSFFNLLMDLRANPAVERAWTTEGQVRYTLKDDHTSYVHKLSRFSSLLTASLKNKISPHHDQVSL